MSVYKRGKTNRFGNPRGPSIPPPKDYNPTRSATKPAGYAEIEAAMKMEQDSPEFLSFVVDVAKMPADMASAVAEAIRQQKWKIAPNPLAVIRNAAHQEAKRTRIEPGKGD